MAEKKILLIVSGGIAAYKSLELVRLVREEAIEVIPVMTASAEKFVTPLTISILSGRMVSRSMYDVDNKLDFGHIELVRQSDLVVVAPATANLIAKTSNGLADDLASNILLATDKPVLMAPAMNVRMWTHSATKRNIEKLKSDGIEFVGPNEGTMACGEFGFGRMAEPTEILTEIKNQLNIEINGPLTGKRVLVTSGPTEEPIDPIRYISNRSSGIQGKAIAKALVALGAKVFFVTGPVHGEMPRGAEIIHVNTAVEMLAKVKTYCPYDIVICAAAVSDWQMKNTVRQKIKKEKCSENLNLELIKTPDVLEQISNFNPRPKLVIGFAAETDNLESNALKKLRSKKCDWILVNSVDAKSGVMGKKDTEIILVSEKGRKVFPLMSKSKFSDLLADLICAEFK